MATLAALYPPDHPYHWLTIGSADDLRATTLDEVRAFFSAHYHPANASLAIAGAIEPERAFTLAEQYFGELRPGPNVESPMPTAAALTGDRRLLLEDRVELPRLYLAWHSPAMFAPGDAELDLVADLLDKRQDIAAVPASRLRDAPGDRSGGVPAVARGVQLLPDRRDRIARPLARRGGAGDRRRGRVVRRRGPDLRLSWIA